VRIVFVTSRFPYPVEKGDKLRAYHQIRELSERHEMHLVAISHQAISNEAMDAMRPFCKSISIFRVNRLLFPLQLLLGWLQGLPLQVSYFLDRTIKRRVQYHIIQLDPDHVICQLIRASPYVRSLPFPKTLDYMDVFSEGMRQRASRLGWLGFPFRWEANRLASFERSIYKDFDRHTIISGQDRNRLSLVTAAQVAIIPNGVDASFVPQPGHIPTHDLVFVGNLGYGPNIEAVHALANDIMPELKRRGRPVSLLIAGARPVASVLKLDQREDITVHGWMEDIRDAYADGRIFVAPMFSGLGLQNKILEAMAMALPCVTTSMVNNAIGATHGESVFVADTIPSMVDYIIQLLEEKTTAMQVAKAGRHFVLEHYTWESQVEKLEAFIQTKNLYQSV
jgi:sugar transferase (PEP-CTERM/EpsH1 system associated)